MRRNTHLVERDNFGIRHAYMCAIVSLRVMMFVFNSGFESIRLDLCYDEAIRACTVHTREGKRERARMGERIERLSLAALNK